MKIYSVGGSVRDELLGLPVTERDHVVVGGTAKALLAQGFKQVGKSFPVFLHPKTNEEYALARTETKVGLGYHGFTFVANEEVTLEEDLARRDLTINAIAKDDVGNLYDPYHGVDDIKNKWLRHVSPAFVEDPVRLLRVARFLARFAALGFKIAPETMQLLQDMVQKGETKALVPERVWQECEKALGEKNPHAFFETLYQTAALWDVFAVPQDFDFAGAVKRLDKAATTVFDKALRLAVFLSPDFHDTKKVLDKLKAPKYYQSRAQQLYQFAPELTMGQYRAESILKILRSHPAIVADDILQQFLNACFVIQGIEPKNLNEIIQKLYEFQKAVNAIKSETFIKKGLSGVQLGQAIEAACIEAINKLL